MADLGVLNKDNAVTFMVSAGLVYEIIAAACSSPQTAEINAARRSATLMKWVRIGLAQSALFVGIAAFVLRGNGPALAGGALAAGLMWWSYDHANKAGLANAGPSTEQY